MQDSLIEELSRRWAALNVTGRFALVAGAVASIGILALVVLWSKRPDYRPLFTSVKPAEASAITRKLKELKVPYQIGEDGESILVPSSQVYSTRMELAGSGLPENGAAGYELFDKTRLQTSPLSERVTYVRALQGELASTISSMAEVDSCRVHLVLPQHELLVDDSKNTSASIFLKLKPGANISPAQVRAIKALVAGSVQSLTKDNITVVDGKGLMLSSGDESSETAGASTLSDLQRTLERNLERKTQEMLDRVVGPGNSVVRVTLQLEASSRTVESQQFTPADTKNKTGVVRSTQTVDESYNGASGQGQQPPQIPTLATAQKAAALAKGGPNGSSYKNARGTTNYEVSSTREKQVLQPGAIRRMTVAVIIKSPSGATGGSKIVFNRDALDNLTEEVKQATGYDATRKDEVAVRMLNFNEQDTSADAAALAKEEQQKRYMEWARIAAPIAAVMLFWLVAGRMGRRPVGGVMVSRGTNQLGQPLTTPSGNIVAGSKMLSASTMGMTASQQLEALAAGGVGNQPYDPFNPNAASPEHLGLHARMIAMDDPQATANLLERWMAEGE